MGSSHEARSGIVLPPLALLGAGLVVLYVGGFIQLDDTSGFGSHEWVMPLGLVAGLLVVTGVGIGLRRRIARRALGAAFGVLDLLLVLVNSVDDGFRFIWAGDEGELFFLQVALGLAALFLLIPTFYASSEATEADPSAARALSGWARRAVFVTAVVVAVFVAFYLGAAHFVATQCRGPGFDGECDVAALEGLLWAGIAFLVGAVAFVVDEVRRTRRHRAERSRTPGTR